jgi:4-amino-4-deoxy-L-arabinose transferase-like glycosyltransferase
MTKRQSAYLLYALLAILLFSLFQRLDFLALKFEEPRRALVSLEMIRTGDWLHPSIYGLPYFNKPPVYNWILALFFKVFGYADWVIRLPTVLSLISISILHFFFYRNRIGNIQALWSSVFFVTSLNIFFYFSFQGEIDMFYSLVVYTQVLAIFHFFHKQEFWKLFIWSYLLTVIGFLTKGVPSLGFQGLTLIGLMFYFRKFRWFFSIPHLISGVLAVILVAVYFIAYDATGGQSEYYLSKIFFEGTRRTVNYEKDFPFIRTILTFIPLLVYLLSPWLPLGFLGLSRSHLKNQWNNPWLRYAFVFLIFNLPLYWLSAGTRDRYLYIFLPFSMIWIVDWVIASVDKRHVKIGSAVLFGVLGLVSLGMLFSEYRHYPSGLTILVVFGVIFPLCGWLTFKNANWPVLHTWLIVLVTLRLGFNMLVFDVRKQEDRVKDYEHKAIRISELLEGNSVSYYTPISHNAVILPLLNENVYFPEIKRLNYSFTYYLNRKSGGLIKHSEILLPKQYYLVEVGEHIPIKFQIMGDFDLDGITYRLIKT